MKAIRRFVVDHMLVKLGKYLRITGQDAVWDSTIRTHELISLANREGRVFLTRNGHLDDRYPRPQALWIVRSTDPREQLFEVARAFGLNLESGLFTQCIKCNLPLAPVAEKSAIRERVHPNVYARHAAFFTCPGCGTVFWKGSHVRNTCRKLGVADISDRPEQQAGSAR